MNRKVKYARLQTGMYIPGLTGELGTVLPPQNKTLDNLVMTAFESGIIVDFSYKGTNKSILIPYGNLVLADLILEPAPKTTAKVGVAA